MAGRLLLVWLNTITVEARWPVVAAFEPDQSRPGLTFPMCYGPEFVATVVKAWITTLGARPAYIEPGCSWESSYVESFNGKFRDELLACEASNTLAEAKILIEQWRKNYNTVRPHSSLGYRPPAPEVVLSRVPLPTSTPGPAGPVTVLGLTMN